MNLLGYYFQTFLITFSSQIHYDKYIGTSKNLKDYSNLK